MAARLVRGIALAAVAMASLAACDSRRPSSLQGFLQYVSDLESLSTTVANATGYPADHVDVSGNRTELNISIHDLKLAASEDATLERAATAVVAAAEPVLTSHVEFASVKTINVWIYHPSGFGPPVSGWHVENVVEFRRGPDQRFTIHGP